MKRIEILFVVAAMLVPLASDARDNIVPIGCQSVNDVPGDFYNKCLLNGGTEVRCSGGTPMCCKKDATGTHCYDNPEDVKGRRSTMPSGQTTPPKLAPATNPSTLPTAPKQSTPLKAVPLK